MLITDLGRILSGVSFPKKPFNEPNSDYLIIESENLDTQGNIKLVESKCISFEQHRLPANILLKNDILIRAKGNNHQAIIFEHDSEKPVIATSYFLIIRIYDQDKFPPTYIACLLNQQVYQDKLSALAGGGTVKHLTKKRLFNLTITPPPTYKLKLIYELKELVKIEQTMELKLSQLKQELYKTMTNELME